MQLRGIFVSLTSSVHRYVSHREAESSYHPCLLNRHICVPTCLCLQQILPKWMNSFSCMSVKSLGNGGTGSRSLSNQCKGNAWGGLVINRASSYTLELCFYTFSWGIVCAAVPQRSWVLSSCLYVDNCSQIPKSEGLMSYGKTHNCSASWLPFLMKDHQPPQVIFHFVSILALVLSSIFSINNSLVRRAFHIWVNWLIQSETQKVNSGCISGASFKATGWTNRVNKKRRNYRVCSTNLKSLMTVYLRNSICKEELVKVNSYKKVKLGSFVL